MIDHPASLAAVLVMGFASVALAILGYQALTARGDPDRNLLTRLLDRWVTRTYGRFWGEPASVAQIYFSLTCFLCAALAALAAIRDLFRFTVTPR